jgi:hypothetical protein
MATATTTSSESLVCTWIKHCRDNASMHDMSRAYFRMYNMLTMIPAIFLASASGISMLGMQTIMSKGEDCSNHIAVVFLGACGLVSGTLISVNRFLRYPELQEHHDIYGDSFQILHNELELQHAISDSPESVFKSRIEFIKYCKHRMDILIDKAPAIPGAVRKKYNRMNCT